METFSLMIQTTEEIDHYISSFSDFQKSLNPKEPAWLDSLRRAALEEFSRLGFPTTHDEEWRFTNLAPIARTAFRLAETKQPKVVRKDIGHLGFGGWPGIELVVVDGFFRPDLSSTRPLPEGTFAGGLKDAGRDHSDLVEAQLARHADPSKDAFVALNTAFLFDGIFIYVPKGTAIEDPIHVLFVSTKQPGGPSVSHARTLLVAEESSEIRILESYASLDSGSRFTNSVTEILAAENAAIDHYKLQRESFDAFHIGTIQVQLQRNSNVSTQSISLGGALVRNQVNALLNGEGAEATLNGFYLVNGTQHVDNHTSIDHAKPRCSSHELYKGILDGRSRAVFNGRIIVRPDAQKTDSKQTNKNLILSEDALVNTNPQLEIYANDVKCTHGATIGQLDAEALFYIRSRGIDLESARHTLTYAFAGDFIQKLKIEPLRKELERMLYARLAEGQDGRSDL